jgi:subtilisin family serine protease
MRILLTATLVFALLLADAPQTRRLRAQSVTKYTAALDVTSQVHNREIIVQLDGSVKSASAVLSNAAGVKHVSTVPLSYGDMQVVRVPDGQDYMAALRALESDPRVVSVGPNVKKTATAFKNASALLANDPRFLNGAATAEAALELPTVRDSQWGLLLTGAQDAWETTTGDPSVVVAVIDTGVNFAQSDMQGRWWTNKNETPNDNIDNDSNGFIDDYRGYDFYTYNGSSGGDNDPTDEAADNGDISHGLATSSIIGARINNNIGMAGVAGGTTSSNGVRIMPLRVGTDSDIPVIAEIAAIDYAIENGAKVISMSFGGPTGGQPEEDAIDRAWNAGVLTFAAAGNVGAGNGNGDINAIDLPAGFDNCICVGATTIFDSQGIGPATDIIPETVANYSKRGPEMDLAGPGTHIISAVYNTNEYTSSTGSNEFTGTSAATPLVAGIGALILSANPGMTNTQALQVLKNTAVDLGASGFDDEFGFGRVNAAAAVPPPPDPDILGDYNSDGVVNDADVAVVKQRYGATTGQSNFLAAADGNGDGVIDELDVFLIGRNFGNTAP